MDTFTFQVGIFPILEVEPRPLSDGGIPTLTEVVTLAIYGAALTPADFRRQRLVAASVEGETRQTEKALEVVQARARRFYKVLGRAVNAGDVVLTGIERYLLEDAHFLRPELPLGQTTIKYDDLCQLLSHHPDDNEFDINPAHETDDVMSKRDRSGEMYDIFASDRWTRRSYVDIRVSFDHAQLILSLFAAAETERATVATEGDEPLDPTDAPSAEEAVAQETGETAPRDPRGLPRPAGSRAFDDNELDGDGPSRVGRPSIVHKIREQDAKFRAELPNYSDMTLLARSNMLGQRLLADGKVDKHPSPSSFSRAIGSKAKLRQRS